MKHWIAYLFSFYILFSALVPCSFFDACDDEKEIATSAASKKANDCASCPPFSLCASCPGVAINHESISPAPLLTSISPAYGNYDFSFRPGYAFAFFQPPRTV